MVSLIKKYDSVELKISMGLTQQSRDKIDAYDTALEMDKGEEPKPEDLKYFKQLSFILFSGGEYLALHMCTEIATFQEYCAFKERQLGNKFLPDEDSLYNRSSTPNMLSQESIALGHFFRAAAEAVKNDGFVDMRVYPPVARTEFTA